MTVIYYIKFFVKYLYAKIYNLDTPKLEIKSKEKSEDYADYVDVIREDIKPRFSKTKEFIRNSGYTQKQIDEINAIAKRANTHSLFE